MERKIEIGGMTYDSYDAEEDHTGAIGHALADARERQTGIACIESPYWAGIAQVALSRFSELQQGESISVGEIKRRLFQIRQEGYKVKPYSHMSKQEAWNYLNEIRRDVRDKAGVEAPGALERIDRMNVEKRRAARDELR